MSNRSVSFFGASFAILAVTSFSAPAMAVGEEVNGFPNWAERVLLELSNRARVEPQLEMMQCGSKCAEAACYMPKAPLYHKHELSRAARFHSDEMVKQNFFAHTSKCTIVNNIDSLYPAQCDGSASCACVGGVSMCNPTCTGTQQRVGLFNTNYSGEIIASSSNPQTSFYLWLYEDAKGNPECKFTTDNGHRWLILTGGPAVGYGVTGRAVGDFGGGGDKHKIPSGSHWPRQASSVEAWANWFDTAGPKSALVNVDGQCSSMQLTRGVAENGAYKADVSGVGTGCHRYYFVFKDANDVEVSYPETGSLGIGPAASCADWDTSRPPLGMGCNCTPQCNGMQCGDDGCGGVCGMCGANEDCQAGTCVPQSGTGGSSGVGGNAGTGSGAGGGAGTGTGTGGVSGAGGAGTGGNGGEPSDDASCGCRAAGTGAGGSAALFGVGALLLFGVRRRRR